MREIFYNSNITPKAIHELKLLALYYDKVNIVSDAVYSPKFDTIDGDFIFTGVEDLQFIPKTFNSDYKLLLDEKIISITEKKDTQESNYDKALKRNISNLLNANHHLIFPMHPSEKEGRVITEEVYDVMKYMFDFKWGKPVEIYCVWYYYAIKLEWFLKLLSEGKNCLSSSENLNQLFNAFMKEFSDLNRDMGGQGYNKSLALDALKIGLPNPTVLSFEDILEMKLKLKDELAFFYQTINAIEVKHKELFSSYLNENEYQAVFFEEIKKPLKDLEVKMKNLNSSTFRKFIERMQDPKSYVPLIGTVVATVPVEYSLMASVGLTAGQSYLEYKEEKRELSNNALYFLLQLKA